MDDEPGAPLVAVISDGYWERQFQRSPAVIGQSVLLNAVSVTIVGVSPRGFVGANVGSMADVTVTVAALPGINPEGAQLIGPGNFWLQVLARPASGITISEATARLTTRWPHLADTVLSSRWSVSRRQAFGKATFELRPGGTGSTAMRELYRKPLMVLMAAVGLVLLIACANVASLLLARATAQHRETAVRLAIGASRGRIVRQLLTESLLLSLIGAVFGVFLAWASGRLLVNSISGPFHVTFDLSPNWHILGFAGTVAVGTSLLFSLAPLLHIHAAGPSSALKEDPRISSARSRTLSALVSAQVALSLLIVTGAGLFVRTLRNLQDLDPGFNRDGVLLIQLEGRRAALAREWLDDVQRIPGVAAATVATHTPLIGAVWGEPAVPRGQPVPEKDTAFFVGAGPHFFHTMQTPLLAGREFTERDANGAPPVAVINEALARRYFANQNPLGQYLSALVIGERKELEIVGVSKDTNAAGLRNPPPPTVYVPYLQLPNGLPTNIVVRGIGSLARVASALHDTLQPKMPSVPVEVVSLSAQVDAAMVQERLMATLAGLFGILALTLACVGLYGQLAYHVARQTKELGIRIALGAQRTRLVAMVLTGTAKLALIGVLLGLPAAWAVSHGVETMLFGVRPTDPATIGGAVLVLTTAALVAAFMPARRATRVDPLIALRAE
ncbi:MAG: hypothetical protein DMF89_22030 [Acidobacteria bacterium]|nr:MAG: hypothetical protein DMF89_22030 [Acidobacteriota bacterium]